ncbi:hypothetical protein [Massilia sp. S19_KUP03_FR1]|uniref:hypothetical protein n=1 Tax=Massilia sp. S19_KUP03_FR1 TaxID=3025503 RepID=UPI002FCDB491
MLKLTLLALAALHGGVGAATPAATPAAVNASLPPPGLYRVDMDANNAYQDGTRVALQQSAAGGVTMRAGKPGSAPTTRTFPAQGPQQICIGDRSAGGFNPMALNAKANCKSSSVVTGAAGTTFTAKCDAVDFTSVVRKLNATTWEVKTQVDMHQGGKGMLDFDAQRKMFETALKNATTPEDRADAQDTLDHWEEYKTEMRQSAAEAGAAGAPGAVTRSTSAVTKMTRLGDCTVAGAAAGKAGR